MQSPQRRIAHLDMDAFFASVELLRYPQLNGLPLVIGGSRHSQALVPNEVSQHIPPAQFPRLRHYTGRGVITTATYAARQFGIGSAMGLMKAAKLCPDAILLPVDFDAYRHYSRSFKAVIATMAPVIENMGIDEVFIDFTEALDGQVEGGKVLAQRIQQGIFDATGLTCSVGVAPNKLLAKMASEFNKPNGISIVYAEDLQGLIWPLPCRKINGIGPKSDAKLQALGIRTIGELAARSLDELLDHFGQRYGAWLHHTAWGHDDRPIVTSSEPVTVSREITFERNLHAVHDRAALGEIFTRLCEQVAADLQRKGYAGKTVGIKLRDDYFKTSTRNHSLPSPTNDAATIRRAAGLALKRAPLDRPLRLLGVRVDGLSKAVSGAVVDTEVNSGNQPSLF